MSVEICKCTALGLRARTQGTHYCSISMKEHRLESVTTDIHLCFQNLGGGQIPVSCGSREHMFKESEYLLARQQK